MEEGRSTPRARGARAAIPPAMAASARAWPHTCKPPPAPLCPHLDVVEVHKVVRAAAGHPLPARGQALDYTLVGSLDEGALQRCTITVAGCGRCRVVATGVEVKTKEEALVGASAERGGGHAHGRAGRGACADGSLS